MNYHLARVAYWLQNRSVAPYQTNVTRQIVLPPGAEYVLTVLQGISGSDRAAALVQYGSWWLLALSAPSLARIFGAPRTVALWATLFVAAAPMALLQASSTQNDLLAAVMALAAMAASLPFLHRRLGWRHSDLVILFVSMTAGAIVKPTSLVVTSPFLAWACWEQLIKSRP
jgi:hypothetical protein